MLYVFGVHKLLTVFADHDGVFHVATPAELLHVVLQVVVAFVLNAVPVPDVVLPPGHAVHAVAPAELYDPVAHAF